MKISIRDASIDDVDVVSRITVTASDSDPSWEYRYPLRSTFPEDRLTSCRYACEGFLTNSNPVKKLHVMVAEAEFDDNPYKLPISVAVWEISAIQEDRFAQYQNLLSHSHNSALSDQLKSASYPESHKIHKQLKDGNYESGGSIGELRSRDAIQSHVDAWTATLDIARKEYLQVGSVQRPLSYIHLQYLGTIPEYHRHGAGSMLMSWGIALADYHGLDIGLFATAMGRPLYRRFQFDELASVTVQIDGEKENVTCTCMRRPPLQKKDM
jgi:GNAT superfamily N-acetyltransferase